MLSQIKKKGKEELNLSKVAKYFKVFNNNLYQFYIFVTIFRLFIITVNICITQYILVSYFCIYFNNVYNY